MEAEVQAFEESILFFADAYNKHGPGSTTASSTTTTPPLSTPGSSDACSSSDSDSPMSPPSRPSMHAHSVTISSEARRPSFARRLSKKLESLASEQAVSDDEVSDNVVQHMLGDRTGLLDEKWAGTEDEERFAYVSELLYIHSKVMIVDDRRVIVSVPLPLQVEPAGTHELLADGVGEHQRPQPEGVQTFHAGAMQS